MTATSDRKADAVTTASAGLERIADAGATTRRGVPRLVRKALGPVLLIGLWAAGSAMGWISERTLPAPWTIVATAWAMIVDGSLPEAMGVSLQRVAIGVVLGALGAVVLGVAAGLFRLGEDIIDAPMQMLRTLPWAGLVPLLIIWFGIYETPKITLVALSVLAPVYLNIYSGIRSTDNTLVEAVRTLGVGRWGLIRHVVLPSALAPGLVGLRYGIGAAWLALVFAEQVNAQSGLGYLTNHARSVYRTDIIIVALIVYALLGLASDWIVRVMERRLLSWRPAFSGT